MAYADDGHVHLVPTAGGPPRRLVEGGAPVWVDDRTLVIAVEHEDTSRLAVVGVDDPWPRRLASDPCGLDDHGDEADAAVAPRGDAVAYVFRPRADLGRTEIRVADLRGGAVRALTGTAGLQDREPAWSPDGATIAYASEGPGWWALHVVGRDGSGDRRLTADGADYAQPRWHPDGGRILAVRGRRNRFDLVVVDAAGGEEEVVATGGAWRSAHWAAGGAIAGACEDHATPPELRLVTPGGAPRTLHAPAPLPVRRAPHVAPEEVTYRSLDGLEVPAFLFRPPSAAAGRPVAAVVYPHGGPTAAYVDHWDGMAQYLVARGYAWLAPNFRGSTGYGRAFERRNHGVWGVADTRDCLAAADFLRTLDWIDGDRLGIVGGSYGAYLAVLAVADDPDHRFRCAVAMYGDSDIRTSWAQGDRDGRLDLQRMMGHPHVPDRGARLPARRPAAGLPAPARALPGLAPHVVGLVVETH